METKTQHEAITRYNALILKAAEELLTKRPTKEFTDFLEYQFAEYVATKHFNTTDESGRAEDIHTYTELLMFLKACEQAEAILK